MLKNLATVSNNKSNVFLLVLALIVGGVGAQATSHLNTQSAGYVVCVNPSTKVVTLPGTTTCPTGFLKRTLGAQGAPGATGLTGAAGATGATGATGPAGVAGAGGSLITELFLCDGPDAGTVADEKCKIGMTGPGGGLIFFVDYNDQYAGFNYLEAARQGWGNLIVVNLNQDGFSSETTGTTTDDPLMKWCGGNNTTLLNLNNWSNSGVGKGATNTSTADNSCAGGAIQAAADYVVAGITDWFLPSMGEAMLMYTNLRQAGVGGFSGKNYWSSSESSATSAWSQQFSLGTQSDSGGKTFTLAVRPVRAF